MSCWFISDPSHSEDELFALGAAAAASGRDRMCLLFVENGIWSWVKIRTSSSFFGTTNHPTVLLSCLFQRLTSGVYGASRVLTHVAIKPSSTFPVLTSQNQNFLKILQDDH